MNQITKRMRKIGNLISNDLRIKLDSIEYDEGDFTYLRDLIYKYVKNDYPLTILLENWKEIRKLGNDSSSLKSFTIRYGEDIGTKLYNEKCKKSIFTKEQYEEKYGKDEANRILSERGSSIENFIRRHGEIEGLIKWNQYCDKRKDSYEKGKKEKKYASRDLRWFQEKHGDDYGYQVWDNKRKKQAYKVSKQFYIELYGKEEGERLCKLAKTRSLINFIKKYGKDEGELRYTNWIKNINKGLVNRKSYSNWSIECCEEIKKQITDLFYYSNNELIWNLSKKYADMLGQKIVKPDLFYKGKIIEFHGDIFHGNPDLYNNDSYPHPFRKNTTASELWVKDKNRKLYYESKGYVVLEVWENDYKINKHEVIKKCLEFLN